jgi:cobalt transporter subunit CbtB
MTTRTADIPTPVALDATRLSGVLTLIGGLALLFLVAFVQVPAVHNGAHDTRHANGFPCH